MKREFMKNNSSDFTDGIRIKDVIRKVQQELMESQKEREELEEPPLFEVEGMELEIHFVARKTTDAKAGLSLPVVDVGANRNYSNEQIQKLKIRLRVVEEGAAGFNFTPKKESGSRPNYETV